LKKESLTTDKNAKNDLNWRQVFVLGDCKTMGCFQPASGLKNPLFAWIESEWWPPLEHQYWSLKKIFTLLKIA
jgi:hypothetical protein